MISIAEMAGHLKQSVIDLQKLIQLTQRLTNDNNTLISQIQDELKSLKTTKLKNIDAGFFELQKKLDQKRINLKIEIENEFLKE